MAEGRYLVLARKWRPQTFEDVVGQEHITRTLQNAIEAGRVGHAFLFIGSRGIGKTTTARILSKALNCSSFDAPTPHPCGTCSNCMSIAAGNNIDVIEIDGASNNSVDNVREIREHVRMVPSSARYKIYIIDEVHQLSIGAFNALLKTLEEPPAHAVFILATTEAAKIPATIVSRCQRYDFRRVALNRICDLLRRILEAEGVACSDEALHAVARAADGGMRDAESILDQLLSYCGDTIRFQDVFDVLGLVDWRVLHELCDALLAQDIGKLLHIVEDVVACGKDLSQFLEDILQYFRNLLVCKTADGKSLLALPDEELAAMQAYAERFTLMQIIRLVEQFAELTKDFDSRLAQRIALETLFIRLSKVAVDVSIDTVLDKLVALGQGGISSAGQREASSSVSGGATARIRPSQAPKAATLPRSETAPSKPTPAKTPSRKPVKAAEANLDKVWQLVASESAQADGGLSLGITAGMAKPVRVEDTTLVLHLAADQSRARALLERPEHRVVIESLLAELTQNLRSFRCEVGAADDTPPPPLSASSPAFAARVNPEEARAALENPHVAKVMDVFKGRIVDIKHNAGAAPSE